MSKIATLVYQVGIHAHHAGFGMYDRQASAPAACDGYAAASDILCEIDGEVYELGKDDLPETVDDIRGRVYNEPDRVFAVVDRDGHIGYFGLESRKVEVDDQGIGRRFI